MNSYNQSTTVNFMSDLHLEMEDPNTFDVNTIFPENNGEVLILAGDISTADHPLLPIFFKQARRKYKYVIYLPGNHEYYGQNVNVDYVNEYLQKLCNEYDVLFLHNKVFVLFDIVFIGSTLWSYIPPELYSEMCEHLNDFRYIKDWKPENSSACFYDNAKFIENSIKEYGSKRKVVVITHHAPLKDRTSQPKYEKDPTSCGFTNNCKDLLNLGVDYWIFGHTHYNNDFHHNNTNSSSYILSNQRGYNGTCPNWDKNKTLYL